MELKRISYSEYVGGSQEWTLEELALGKINLLVGKNATGKTRCLNLINGLAVLLSGSQKQLYNSGSYDAEFENGNDKVQYVLEIKNSKVVHESFAVNGDNLMTRGQGGTGTIFAEEIGKPLNFQAPESSIAAVARQDKIQHKFLECLQAWAKRVIRYEFGSPLGKDQFAVLRKDITSDFDPRETSKVISFFVKGKKEFGRPYIDAIKNDLNLVHYRIEEIDIKKPSQIRFPADIGEPVGLYVKEADLSGITEQINISQGMFRVLSLIVQVNYCQMAVQPSCILIDDIGEGLDFDRSVSLIKLLMDKISNSQIQLIMATNDRFVMNKVPLNTWCVLKREGSRCKVYNYANAKKQFDDFKFTGMNNFDFFMSDFITEGLPKDE